MTQMDAATSARRARIRLRARLAGAMFRLCLATAAVLLAFADLPAIVEQKILLVLWGYVLLALLVIGGVTVVMALEGTIRRYTLAEFACYLGRGLTTFPVKYLLTALLFFTLYWDGRLALLALYCVNFALNLFHASQPKSPMWGRAVN